MKPTNVSTVQRPFLGLLAGALLIVAGCSAYASRTVIRTEQPAPAAEDFQADEFVGTPIMGDYDDNPDLDFVLQVVDGERVFKIEVHEEAAEGNQELLDKVRNRINANEDRQALRVIGYYSPEYKGAEKEYGFLNLKCIVFIDETSGQEEAFFTDPKDSRYYQNADVTIIYAPGHHLRSVYYPRYVSPWWDADADGIPDRYDPWPYSYDIWYDYNLNYIPDWYDPYYSGYYPYWNSWSLDFWVGYRWYSPYWYSPYYYGPGFNTWDYYNDYRTYTRLYDRTRVNSGHNRAAYRLDVKSEALQRQKYDRGPRGTAVSSGSRTRGYDSRPVDNRMLVTPNRDRDAGGGNLGNVSIVDNTTTDVPNTFNRNRAADYTPAGSNRERSGVSPTASTVNKRKSPGTTSQGEVSQAGRSRVTRSGSSGSDLSRARNSGREPVYRPVERSRSAEVRGSANTSPSSSGTYRGSTSRSRSEPAPADRSRVSPSRERSSSRPAPSGSGSVSSGSRSRSAPAPAASSAPSRSRSSGSTPSASSSSGSSRSRDSGSSSSSSSGGGDRRRR